MPVLYCFFKNAILLIIKAASWNFSYFKDGEVEAKKDYILSQGHSASK